MRVDECGGEAGEADPERFDIGPGSGPFLTEGTGRDRGHRRHRTRRLAVHVREWAGDGHGEGLSFSVWLRVAGQLNPGCSPVFP